MEEINIKIKYEKSSGHNPHEGTIPEIIANGLRWFMEVDMETEDIVKEGWSVEIQ